MYVFTNVACMYAHVARLEIARRYYIRIQPNTVTAVTESMPVN
jgi:hypothetical protein